MKLIRSGSRKFHGWTTLIEEQKTGGIVWDKDSNAIVVNASWVDDPNAENASYNYRVILTLDDVKSIITELSESGISESSSALAEHPDLVAPLFAF